MSATDRLIQMQRQRGFEVIDRRGRNWENQRDPYGWINLHHIEVIAFHWTGDSFNRYMIQQVTGTDYGVDYFSPHMSVNDEVDLIQWYARYHGQTLGWGGIAYHVQVFPSGRTYVNWDIGRYTFHAFDANRRSVAVCCPNSNWAQPYPRQLAALRSVLDILSFHTPEIPAGARQVYGHRELAFMDSRNGGTVCPGTFSSFIQQYRSTATPIGEVKPVVNPVAPPPAPNALELGPDGGPKYWVIEEMAKEWTFLGVRALPTYGWPKSGMFGWNGRLVQIFERGAMAVDRSITNTWRVVNLPPHERAQAIAFGKQHGFVKADVQ